MIYIMNTLIVPINFDKEKSASVDFRLIDVNWARHLLKINPWESAIGHEGTAKILTQILGVEIPFNRKSIYFEAGDIGIHFFLKQRLPEGKILTEEEIKNLEYWLVQSDILE